ncbi:MAG: ribbon-helix-helix protein, CopG family [Stackebrandtia sp.]
MTTHRFQLVLDDDLNTRVRDVARETGASVSAIIREAIARGLPTTSRRRKDALDTLLSAPPMEVGSAEDLRDELDEIRGGGL